MEKQQLIEKRLKLTKEYVETKDDVILKKIHKIDEELEKYYSKRHLIL